MNSVTAAVSNITTGVSLLNSTLPTIPVIVDGNDNDKFVATKSGKVRNRDARSSGLDIPKGLSDRNLMLFCVGTGHWLQVRKSRVRGQRSRNPSPYAVLQFISVAVGVVRIQGNATGRFVCMRKNGKLYTSKRRNRDCLFREEWHEQSRHTVYYSCTWPKTKETRTKRCPKRKKSDKWFIGLKKNGKPFRASKVKRKRRKKGSRRKVQLVRENVMFIPKFVTKDEDRVTSLQEYYDLRRRKYRHR